MNKLIYFPLFAYIIFSGTLLAENYVTIERTNQQKYKDDSLTVKALDPAFSFFPDSSLVDFSFLLNPPAGQFGFVKTGDDGHFYFSDNNQRIKFWGMVISQEHVDIPKERIKEVVESLARCGVNMLRLHAFDNRGGEQFGLVRRTVIDDSYPNNNNSQHFNKDVLDRIDFWVSECKKRGIYIYLVLRGYRTFKEGDDVPNADKLDRAARPYAMFDKRLIELQKKYAKEFLCEHINPYTNLSFAEDPAVAAIEIFNEDSIFMRPEKWQDMVEPYLSNFTKMWNEWLIKKYGTTEKLKTAWTNNKGECALSDDESLEKMNIILPNMNFSDKYEDALNADYKDKLKSPVRRMDAAAFGIGVQLNYLNEMKTYLKQIGVKIPLTGVVYSQIVPDTYTVANALDFPAENAYIDHPTFLPGKDWVSKAFFQNINSLTRKDEYSFMPFTTRYKWADKPLGIREWATCWPNEFRASSILETAAYAKLQDIDLLTFFQYNVTGDLAKIGPFNITCDPARWGLFGIGAKIFLDSDLQPAKYKVEIGYSKSDLTAWANFMQPHHGLSWLTKVSNRFVPDNGIQNPKHDLFIVSGRTHNTNLKEINNALIYSNCSYIDFSKKEAVSSEDNIIKKSGYDVPIYDGEKIKAMFSNIGFDKLAEVEIDAKKIFMTDDIKKKNYIPVGIDGEKCLGFYDSLRKNLIFAYLPDEEVPKLGAQLLKFWHNTPCDYFSFDNKEDEWLISDTGEIKRNTTLGIEIIDTPQVQVIQGEMIPEKEYSSSFMKIKTPDKFAVFVAVSLDNKPLKESKYFVVKMVTKAGNRSQVIEKGNHPQQPDYYMIFDSGQPPVQTYEKPSDIPIVVELCGKKIMECYMTGGWWEAVFNENESVIYLASSGRNIKFVIHPTWLPADKQPEFEETRYYYDTTPSAANIINGEVIYPSFQKYIRLRVK